ncbi:MAG: condensation domain-containing protein, partial [Tumebacillaceae bacterium]
MSAQDTAKLAAAKLAFLQKRLKGKSETPPEEKQLTRRTTTGPVPLSFAQQRLWFLDQLETEQTSSYHVPCIWLLEGTLNVEAMEQSIREITRRHGTLRTTFPLGEEGQPHQVIDPQVSVSLPITDLTIYPEAERQAVADKLTVEEIWKPFDLASDLPSRVRLLRLSEHKYILIWTVHHIVTDGWSLGVINKELITLYEAFCSGADK